MNRDLTNMDKKLLETFLGWLSNQEYLCSTVICGVSDSDVMDCTTVDSLFQKDLLKEFMKWYKLEEQVYRDAILEDGRNEIIDILVLKEACNGQLTPIQMAAVDDVLTNFLEKRIEDEDLPLLPVFEFLYTCYGCQLKLKVDDTIDKYHWIINDFSRFAGLKLVNKKIRICEDFRTGDFSKEYIFLFDVGV